MNDEILERIDELAYDIRMSLETGLPVNVLHENELMMLLEEMEESNVFATEELRNLTEFLLDYDGDDAWNIKNMLCGDPLISNGKAAQTRFFNAE